MQHSQNPKVNARVNTASHRTHHPYHTHTKAKTEPNITTPYNASATNHHIKPEKVRVTIDYLHTPRVNARVNPASHRRPDPQTTPEIM